MRSKTLLALAIAGALGTSGSAFAWSGTHHSAHEVAAPISVSDSTPWIQSGSSSSSTSFQAASNASMGLRLSDELAFSSFDEDFGIGASSSDSDTGLTNPFATEVYIVPEPLAANVDSHYWTATIDNAEALDRIATENVYVMTPIYDAIVDPQLVLARGVDAITLAQLSTGEFASS